MRLGYCAGSNRDEAERGGSFNEAEAHAPRIPASKRSLNAFWQICFNEAEAHAPRIPTTWSTWQQQRLPRFNEAEAHAPRIRSVPRGGG